MDGLEDYYEQPNMIHKRKKKKKRRGGMGQEGSYFESPDLSKTAHLAGHHMNYYKDALDSDRAGAGTDADIPNRNLFASEGPRGTR